MPTVYNYLEGALALAARLPLFILFEEGMERTGIFVSGTKTGLDPEERRRDMGNFRDVQKVLSSMGGADLLAAERVPLLQQIKRLREETAKLSRKRAVRSASQ